MIGGLLPVLVAEGCTDDEELSTSIKTEGVDLAVDEEDGGCRGAFEMEVEVDTVVSVSNVSGHLSAEEVMAGENVLAPGNVLLDSISGASDDSMMVDNGPDGGGKCVEEVDDERRVDIGLGIAADKVEMVRDGTVLGEVFAFGTGSAFNTSGRGLMVGEV